MSVDINFIRAKIDCLINQAKVRGITISNSNGWGVKRVGSKYALCDTIYLLALLIEGRTIPRHGYENTVAAAVLGISDAEVQAFNNGLCQGGGAYENNVLTLLGAEYKWRLGL